MNWMERIWSRLLSKTIDRIGTYFDTLDVLKAEEVSGANRTNKTTVVVKF